MAITTPKSNRRLTMFPTPKYLRIRKVIAAKEMIKPLLVFKRRVERVKMRARNKRAKKTGRAPKECGSTKITSKVKANQRRIMTRRVGKKFFLLLIFSFLFLLAISISF